MMVVMDQHLLEPLVELVVVALVQLVVMLVIITQDLMMVPLVVMV